MQNTLTFFTSFHQNDLKVVHNFNQLLAGSDSSMPLIRTVTTRLHATQRNPVPQLQPPIGYTIQPIWIPRGKPAFAPGFIEP